MDGNIILKADAMGTSFELVLGDRTRRLDERALRAAGEAALAVIREVEERWSLFRPDSRLSELNRAGSGGALRLDADDRELIEVVHRVHRASRGAFDPDVAPGPRGRWWFEHLDGVLHIIGEGALLDFGGVAKGFALDLARRELAALGVPSAFLHGGTSSALTLGRPLVASRWVVRVGGEKVVLREKALACSSTYSQLGADGESHIRTHGIAQRPGRAVRTCVLAPSAALADAWATALCAAPALADRAAPSLARMGVEIIELAQPDAPLAHA